MVHFPEEILEEILIRLEIKDLIRCKSVSKSWLSLISSPDFIKSHLKNIQNQDRNDRYIRNRRIIMSVFGKGYSHSRYQIVKRHLFGLFGSCNGLVCVSLSLSNISIINPETREVNKLKNPKIPKVIEGNGYFRYWIEGFGYVPYSVERLDCGPYLIGGFGYDPLTDDYKVILGFRKSKGVSYFKLLTLRSNVWKDIGELNLIVFTRTGILCNGSLHWVAKHDHKILILSFDLSEDKFKEVPQPDDKVGSSMCLGILDDCLCVFHERIWVMKNYNVKESWELVRPEEMIEFDIVHQLKELDDYVPNKSSLCHKPLFVESRDYLESLVYVPSLVSPHFCRKPKRKRLEKPKRKRLETGSTSMV